MKGKRWLGLLVAVTIVASLVAVRMERVRQKVDAPTLAAFPVSVRVATVVQGNVVHTRHVLGHVYGEEEAQIAARISAEVLEVLIREGEHVRRGQALVNLDPRELEDAVAEAEARVESAREALAAAQAGLSVQIDATARDRTLFDAKAISKEEYDRSVALEASVRSEHRAAASGLDVAKKALDAARTRLGYAHLEAPFAGNVARRLVDPGDLAVPGRPLVVLVRQGGVRVRAQLAEEQFPLLHVGQPVTMEAGGVRVEAQVSRVFPSLDESHLATLEVDLAAPPAGFVAGATVGLDLALQTAEGLVVPVDALLQGERGSFVFTVRDGKVHVVKVEVDGRSTTEAVVRGELQDGDSVIVARPSRLMTLAENTSVHAVDG